MTSKPLTKEDVKQLQAAIDRVESKVDNALTDLRKLESYLYDDDQTNSPGLVQQVRQNTNDIVELKEEKKINAKLSFGLGAGGGGLIMALYEIIKWLLIHTTKT